MREATACATCHRAVWDTDVDAAGNCCFCIVVEETHATKDESDDTDAEPERPRRRGTHV